MGERLTWTSSGERKTATRTAGPTNRSSDRKSTRLNSSQGYISYAVFCLKEKNTRLNSSHGYISYAVFCLKKKNTQPPAIPIQQPPTSATPTPVSAYATQCLCRDPDTTYA